MALCLAGVFALPGLQPLGAQAGEGSQVRRGFFSFFSVNTGLSVLYFPADERDLTYDLSPILASPHLGLGIPFLFAGTSVLSFELSYDGYFTNYLVPPPSGPFLRQ